MFLKNDQKGNEADFWCVADLTEATESVRSLSPVTTDVVYGPCSSSFWPVLMVTVYLPWTIGRLSLCSVFPLVKQLSDLY